MWMLLFFCSSDVGCVCRTGFAGSLDAVRAFLLEVMLLMKRVFSSLLAKGEEHGEGKGSLLLAFPMKCQYFITETCCWVCEALCVVRLPSLTRVR